MKGGLWDTGYEPEVWPDRETYRGSLVGAWRKMGWYQARMWIAFQRDTGLRRFVEWLSRRLA